MLVGHNPYLVTLSVVVAILGGYTGLGLAARIAGRSGFHRRALLGTRHGRDREPSVIGRRVVPALALIGGGERELADTPLRVRQAGQPRGRRFSHPFGHRRARCSHDGE